uniref:Uncharacterized protein n=5 Tax=Triticinae TaxID=1648030 RepID=A0A453JVI7_AEGTS
REREMAAQAWKTRFRQRVAEAHARCLIIPGKIGHARAMLARPLRGPVLRSSPIEIAEESLEGAASDLYTAASLLGSATELALRGGATELFLPSNPVRSIRLLPGTAAAQRRACHKLLAARQLAEEAYDAVELCSDLRLGIRCLLDIQRLPGVAELIEAERLRAYNLLANVRKTADGCVWLVAGALEDLRGAVPVRAT